uniref:SFRICE_032663 n=1 Tax=Spodoptera frugiperda TaxID=7108 RepID=A0A2H1WMA9_SPOFR
MVKSGCILYRSITCRNVQLRLPLWGIYVFLGEHIALVDFVKVMQRRGLLTAGEYAIVAVDDEIYDPSTAAITHAAMLEAHIHEQHSATHDAVIVVLLLTSRSWPEY